MSERPLPIGNKWLKEDDDRISMTKCPSLVRPACFQEHKSMSNIQLINVTEKQGFGIKKLVGEPLLPKHCEVPTIPHK